MHKLLRGAPHILQAGALSYRRRHSSIALEHTSLLAELARIQQRLAELEAVDPTLSAGSTTATATDSAAALFSPPKLHHINLVSRQVGELLSFYRDVMRMDEMPAEMFPRTAAGEHHTGSGFSGKIAFTTDGVMQMHLAERDLSVAFRNGRVINPIEKGHIAFRTDDIEACHTVTMALCSRKNGTRSSFWTQKARSSKYMLLSAETGVWPCAVCQLLQAHEGCCAHLALGFATGLDSLRAYTPLHDMDHGFGSSPQRAVRLYI
jgi:catechol 2,3-dioxygenase-like lactoylglutathione lyase family enzyme